jgi:hypothetical protein
MVILIWALAAQEPVVDVQARAWSARFAGSILADGKSGLGTRVDVDDIGLDGAETAGAVELGLRFPGLGRFSFEYWRLNLDGGQTLEGPIVYDDVFFPAGLAVDAEIDVQVYALNFAFGLLSSERFRLDAQAEGLYIAGRAEIEGAGVTSKSTLNRPLILPGLRAELEAVDGLSLSADLHAIAFSAKNLSLRWVELEVEALVHPWRGLALGLGYRLVRIDAEATEDSTNFDLDGTLHGPYVSIGWQF